MAAHHATGEVPRARVPSMSSPLANYLKAYRKRYGFTQQELAILVGLASKVTVSQYECSVRLPHLRAAIALELLFDVPIAELFPAVVETAANDLAARLHELEKQISSGQTGRSEQKAQTLVDVRARLAAYRTRFK